MSIKRLLTSLLLAVIFLAITAIAIIAGLSIRDRAIDYDVAIEGSAIPVFSRQQIDFKPAYDKTRTLPFTASAIIDIDGDGTDELFIGGGIDQQDAFFRYQEERFVEITASTGWSKSTPDDTYGAISLDLDRDGDNDMLVTRQSGVWLYLNDAGRFAARQLELDLDDRSVPLSVAVADINRDGEYDLYVSSYIAREHVEGQTIFNETYGGVSALFLNTGDHTFSNITRKAGLYYQHNTFQAIFIDVDDDALEDLIVAHDTGQVRTWKNNGDLTFTNMPNPSSDYFAYPMGIGVGDYDNDGRTDFFFSNVGSTGPDALVRGDLREDQVLNKDWLLFNNAGGFQFVDTSEQAKIANYEFSWGGVFEDFNLDGRDDLVVSENYIEFPTHAIAALRLDGRFLIQNSQGEFAAVGKQAGVQNRYFGITPLVSDFNADGYPDLVHVNLEGPQQVFISNAGDHSWLKVKLPNTVDSIGASVTVTRSDGSQLLQTFVVGEGLCSDQTHTLTFGLANGEAHSVEVAWLDGRTASRQGNYKNTVLEIAK